MTLLQFTFASLITAALMFTLNAVLPVQAAHLSINGQTLCGSVTGAAVDVLSADRETHYCPRCQAVLAENNEAE